MAKSKSTYSPASGKVHPTPKSLMRPPKMTGATGFGGKGGKSC